MKELTRQIQCYLLLSILCFSMTSCSETKEIEMSQHLSTIEIEKRDFVYESGYEESATETKATDIQDYYCNITTNDDLYIEGTMGDSSIDVELCIKLPRNYENQKVNIYKVTSTKYMDWNTDTIGMPGWSRIISSDEYIFNGKYGENGTYDYMSDEEIDGLIESFEWKDVSDIPGYSEIKFNGKKYLDYTPYYVLPASEHYEFTIDKKKIKEFKDKPFGVYTVREEIDNLPVGAFYNYRVDRSKYDIDSSMSTQDTACWSICFYDGNNILDNSIFALEDYEIEDENLSIKPLSEVITNAIPEISSILIPQLYGKRIRVYAAELVYLPYFSEDEWGTPQKNKDGKTYVNYKIAPFWVLYYQTDMSVEGYQREVAVINAITGEGIY